MHKSSNLPTIHCSIKEWIVLCSLQWNAFYNNKNKLLLDEVWMSLIGIILDERSHTQRVDGICFHLHEAPKTGKLINGNRSRKSGCLEGEGERGRYSLSALGNLLGCWKCSTSWSGWSSHIYKFWLESDNTAWSTSGDIPLWRPHSRASSCWPGIYSRQEMLPAHLPHSALPSCTPTTVPAENKFHMELSSGIGLTVGHFSLNLHAHTSCLEGKQYSQNRSWGLRCCIFLFPWLCMEDILKIFHNPSACSCCFLLRGLMWPHRWWHS